MNTISSSHLLCLWRKRQYLEISLYLLVLLFSVVELGRMWQLVLSVEEVGHGVSLNRILCLEKRSCRAVSSWGPRAMVPEGGGSLLGSRDPWEQDTWILAWPASSSPMAWVLGATGLGPNPSPSSFFGRRLRVRTPPAVSLLGGLLPPGSEVGRGEGPWTRAHPGSCLLGCQGSWDVMGPGEIYWGWSVREEKMGIR